MPRKKPRRTIPLIEPEILPPDDPDEETVENIVKQFGPGVQIKVNKIVRGVKHYCGYLTSVDNIEENVAALNYGPGEYSIAILVNGELKRVVPIGIAEKVGGLAVQSGDPSIRLVLEQMTRLMDRLANPPQVEREPIGELAEAFKTMHSMLPAQSGQQLSPETIMQWVQLGKELAPGGGGDDWGWLKDVGQGLLQGLLAARSSTPAPVHPSPVGVAPVPQPEAQMGVLLETKLKMAIAYLKQKALRGSDPELYIDVIFDNQELEDYAVLIHAIRNRDFSAFVQIDGDLEREPFKTFFGAIYDRVRSAPVQSDPVETTVTTGETGNVRNINGNGTNGKGGRK